MKNKKYLKYTIAALGIAIVACLLNEFAQWVAPMINPSPPALSDLLFQITPFIFWMKYVSDILIVGTIILLAIYIFPKRKYIFPQVVGAISTMYLLRAVLLFITPIGAPERSYLYYGTKSFLLNSFFPSGHTAFIFMCYLFISKKEAPVFKNVFLLFLVAEIVSLILSRSHYSIDIAGGLLLAYFVCNLFINRRWLAVKRPEPLS